MINRPKIGSNGGSSVLCSSSRLLLRQYFIFVPNSIINALIYYCSARLVHQQTSSLLPYSTNIIRIEFVSMGRPHSVTWCWETIDKISLLRTFLNSKKRSEAFGNHKRQPEKINKILIEIANKIYFICVNWITWSIASIYVKDSHEIRFVNYEREKNPTISSGFLPIYRIWRNLHLYRCRVRSKTHFIHLRHSVFSMFGTELCVRNKFLNCRFFHFMIKIHSIWFDTLSYATECARRISDSAFI